MNIQRLLSLTAAVLAVASPAAFARPAIDAGPQPVVVHRSAPVERDAATLAAHRDAISTAQWRRANAQPVTPLTAAPPSGGGRLPVPVVVIGLAVGLAVGLVQFVGKQVVRLRRRKPASA